MVDQPSVVSGVFRRPFPEQIEFFRGKLGRLVPTRRWDDLIGEAHDTAFMVAGAQKADLLSDLAKAVDRAISEGTGLERFREDFEAAVERNDWRGWVGEGTTSGRAWRTRTIYRTNARVSYAAGRRAQLEARNYPFWVYLHGGSRDPRPEHLHVFHGLVLPPEHPFWLKHYPPSDWGCSCYVLGARSLRAARRLGGDPGKMLPDGWEQVDPATGEPMGIGRGWGYAPGASVARAVAEKARSWDPSLCEAMLQALPPQVGRQLLGAHSEPAREIRSILDLTDSEVRVVRDYTEWGSAEINDALREAGKLTREGMALDAIMQRARLPKELLVWRGIGGEAARLLRSADLSPGDRFSDPGFLSSTLEQDLAERRSVGGGIVLKIRLRAGARALNVSYISEAEYEAEVLVVRDQTLRVIGWDPSKGVLEVETDE